MSEDNSCDCNNCPSSCDCVASEPGGDQCCCGDVCKCVDCNCGPECGCPNTAQK